MHSILMPHDSYDGVVMVPSNFRMDSHRLPIESEVLTKSESGDRFCAGSGLRETQGPVVPDKIVMIRHAETTMTGRFCGHSNPNLNAAGEGQLNRIAGKVAPLGIERIYCSDMLRTARTAAAIGLHIGVSVEQRSGLREIDFGLWEGLSWTEIESQFPHEAELWRGNPSSRFAPGGERLTDFVVRVEEEFAALMDQDTQRTIALVTHLGVIQCALIRLFDIPEIDAWEKGNHYGAVISATRVEGKWRVSV
jgi:alpha-ribazole phosphatase